MPSKLKIAIAGTTLNSLSCVKTLYNDPNFEVSYVITPQPRLIGRKQILTLNPLHHWAEQHHLPLVLVHKKIDSDIKKQILALPHIDYLLVVDFGFYIPTWLLQFPRLCPLNIHPSALPKYRGASPGQFTLLNGETQSAVTLMLPNAKMDEGDILTQYSFPVFPTWNQQDYYQYAFQLINQHLASDLIDLAKQKITPTPQPSLSPTPPARQLTKIDSFIDFKLLELSLNSLQLSLLQPSTSIIKKQEKTEIKNNSNLPLPELSALSLLEELILQELSLSQIINSRIKLYFFIHNLNLEENQADIKRDQTPKLKEFFSAIEIKKITAAHFKVENWARAVALVTERATRAFSLWPEVWTFLPQSNQYLRCKIMSTIINSQQPTVLLLKSIKIEGKQNLNL